MRIGVRNVMRAIAAVTTMCPACRAAVIPAVSSHRRMTAPPWTAPAGFASVGPMSWLTTVLEEDTGRGSIDAC